MSDDLRRRLDAAAPEPPRLFDPDDLAARARGRRRARLSVAATGAAAGAVVALTALAGSGVSPWARDTDLAGATGRTASPQVEARDPVSGAPTGPGLSPDGEGAVAGVTTVVSPDGGEALLLVAADANGELARLAGALTLIDGCLGVGQAVVLWPPGTTVASADPLTIDVPGLGAAMVGDDVELGGGYYSAPEAGEPALGGVAVPERCSGRELFYGGSAEEREVTGPTNETSQPAAGASASPGP